MPLDTNEEIELLAASVARLRALVGGLGAEQLRARAYPTEWTVADVLSHVGSGAEIMQRRLDDVLGDGSLPDDYAQPIWDAWNAKSPEAKAADALTSDGAMLDRLRSLTDAEQASVEIPLGPMQLDLAGFVGLRLNEHALHTWDVAVTFDPSATVPADAAGAIVDNLEMIVRFAGKPTGSERELHVRTSDPVRDFTLSIGTDSVALTPCTDPAHAPDIELPAEAFARLVYGRLDPDHTPAPLAHIDFSELRRVFPGM